jgi:hypothetical protein
MYERVMQRLRIPTDAAAVWTRMHGNDARGANRRPMPANARRQNGGTKPRSRPRSATKRRHKAALKTTSGEVRCRHAQPTKERKEKKRQLPESFCFFFLMSRFVTPMRMRSGTPPPERPFDVLFFHSRKTVVNMFVSISFTTDITGPTCEK